mmetsp:Transcript_65342/g.188230  ORF Transcript_65342/g.188230 Transcript_65342/m.188230 type:complete len:238 (+) Transcript_65342:337-1050(+)
MVQEMADGALHKMAAYRDALLRLIASHRLHQASVAVEVLDPVALDYDGDAALVKRVVALASAVLGSLQGLSLVFRERVVHARRLDRHGEAACEGANYERDAPAEGVARDDHLAILGQRLHVLEDLAVLPLVVLERHALEDAVDAADDHGRGIPGPDAHGGEHRREDLQAHRFGPHPQVLRVVHDPGRICAADCHDAHLSAPAPIWGARPEGHVNPSTAPVVGAGFLDGHILVGEEQP